MLASDSHPEMRTSGQCSLSSPNYGDARKDGAVTIRTLDQTGPEFDGSVGLHSLGRQWWWGWGQPLPQLYAFVLGVSSAPHKAHPQHLLVALHEKRWLNVYDTQHVGLPGHLAQSGVGRNDLCVIATLGSAEGEQAVCRLWAPLCMSATRDSHYQDGTPPCHLINVLVTHNSFAVLILS